MLDCKDVLRDSEKHFNDLFAKFFKCLNVGNTLSANLEQHLSQKKKTNVFFFLV